MHPNKKRRNHTASEGVQLMQLPSGAEPFAEVVQKPTPRGSGKYGKDGGKNPEEDHYQHSENQEQLHNAARPPLPQDRPSAREDHEKALAHVPTATPMATSNSISAAAPAASEDERSVASDFPQIVEKLRDTGAQENQINFIVHQLWEQQFVDDASFLAEFDDCQDLADYLRLLAALKIAVEAPAVRRQLAAAIRAIRGAAAMRRQPSPPQITGYKPPEAQYADMVGLFDRLQGLKLKTVESMFDVELERELLGPFFKGRATIPFFHGTKAPDLRFARMAPNTTEIEVGGHVVELKTGEAPDLLGQENAAVLFRAVSGGGKTSTIFDTACVRRTIYIVCQVELMPKNEQLKEAATSDVVFPQLVNQIAAAVHRMGNLRDAQLEARRMIMADVCARLSFFLWLYQTFPNITPEQALLVQLNDGRGHMLEAFNKLRFAHADTLHQLALHCVREFRVQFRVDNPVAVAIDEAQAAAPQFNYPKPDFHFNHVVHNAPRGLLYEYCRTWMQYIRQPVVVAGTGFNSDAAQQLTSSVTKSITSTIWLPFLTAEDVKARLGEMLDVSDIAWEDVHNLEYLTGRCRLVASVINTLTKVPPERYETSSKTAVLASAIETVRKSAVRQLANGAKQAVQGGTRFSTTVVTRLLQQLHAMAWLFSDQAQGMILLFDAKDATELLGLGLVLLKERSTNGTISVAMDKVGYDAVLKCAEDLGWDAAATIAQKIADATNTNDVELGYKFETLVAAAIVRFQGTVADLIHAADVDYVGTSSHPRRKLPDWTEDARFGCKYHACADVHEVVKKLRHSHESTLLHPDNAMRLDFLQAVWGAFLLLGSANCLSSNLSGLFSEHDFESTALRNVHTPKNRDDDKSALRSEKAVFKQTEAMLEGLPTLRLHVVLPGYAGEEHPGTIQHVAIENDDSVVDRNKSVRLVIDQTNYIALFQDPKLRKVFASILARKRETTHTRSKTEPG